MRRIAVVLSSLLILSCSDSPKKDTSTNEGDSSQEEGSQEESSQEDTTQVDSNEGANSTTVSNSLYGTWVVPCYSIDPGGVYYYSEFTFTSTQFVREDFSYLPTDNACTSPTSSAETTFDATYLSDPETTVAGELIKADLLPVKYIGSGELDWDSSTDGLPDGVNNEYAIFAVTDGKLYFGDISTGDGTVPENRPTATDPESGFSRK